jgi:hypothetical protein
MASHPKASSSRPAASGSDTPATDAPEAPPVDASGSVWWRVLGREPLVHCVALGALLFGVTALWQGRERETILIDRATIDALMQQQGDLQGQPPSAAERALLVQGLTDDAVLLREAYRRGLEQDPVVERHLVQKMRFLLGEEIPEPGEDELLAYFAAEAERYRSPPTVSLDQVFYADPGAVPDDLLERLQAGAEFRGQGDRLFMLGPRLARYSVADLADLLGDELARRIFEMPVGAWQGPLRSPEGVHFVRVAEKLPAQVPAFEEVADWVREDWRHARQQELIAAQVAALRERYRIVTEDGAPP